MMKRCQLFNLAKKYENSEGVEQNYSKAIELYTKAASQGHSKAQYNLSLMTIFKSFE